MSKTTTAAEIIAAAHETADEIARVYAAKTRTMRDGAAIAANALQNAAGTKSVDRLFELAATATAAAEAAKEANYRAANSASVACDYVRKARRTAAAYKAAATRAGFTAEAIERRNAAEQAAQIIEDAYHAAEEERFSGNRAMNAAIDDAREVIKTAKLAAAAEIIRSNRYATEADAREAIRRNLDTRAKDIDAAARDWRRAMPTNELVATKAAAYAFATKDEQAKQDANAERSAKLATTRTRHMNIGEKKQQAHTIDGANGWSARIEYAPQAGNHINHDWRVEVYRNDIYVCHDLFWTIEEAEAYAEAMTREPEPEPEPEQATGKPYTIICTTKANRTEYLHAITVEAANVTEAKKNAAAVIRGTLDRHAFALSNEGTKDANRSVNFCARRYGMTAAEVIEAARAPQGIDLYGATPAEIVNEAMQEAEKAMQEAAEAEHKTADAAIVYDTEAAAAHAAEARRAAIAAERAAAKAAAAASMTGASGITCSTADIVSEYAAYARRDADRATDTAEQNAAEAEQRAEILAGIEDPQTRKYFTVHAIAHQWSPEETAQNLEHMRKISTANRAALALLDAYAEAIGEHPTEDDPETVAAYRVARDEITGASIRATEEQRATVAAMVEAIADRWTQDHQPEPARHYYAQRSPYGVTTASAADDLVRFDSADDRDQWTERDPEHRAAITSSSARRWYPEAFSACQQWDKWTAGGEWTGHSTGGVYATI